MTHPTKPRIGISLDWEPKGSFSTEPYYCLRQHYFDAIDAAGGIPIALPYLESAIDDYLGIVDAVIIPGGDFAFPDNWYATPMDRSPFSASPRLSFDIALIRHTLARQLPLLTICAGMQILACLHGCKLTSRIDSSIDHHKGARTDYIHAVTITPQTQLHGIVKTSSIETNSSHCEAIITPSAEVIVNAIASDGTIEGIELPHYPFAMGVQWHPEFFVASANPHRMLFEALIAHARDA